MCYLRSCSYVVLMDVLFIALLLHTFSSFHIYIHHCFNFLWVKRGKSIIPIRAEIQYVKKGGERFVPNSQIFVRKLFRQSFLSKTWNTEVFILKVLQTVADLGGQLVADLVLPHPLAELKQVWYRYFWTFAPLWRSDVWYFCGGVAFRRPARRNENLRCTSIFAQEMWMSMKYLPVRLFPRTKYQL